MRFRPSVRIQIAAVITLLMVVPVMVMAYDILFASRSDDVLLAEMEERLTGLVNYMAGEIRARLNDPEMGFAGRQGDPGVLAEVFRGVAGPVAQSHPGVRVGLYRVGSENILTEGYLHETRLRLPEAREERERRILEEARAGIKAVLETGSPITRVGQTYDDRFLEYLVPLRVDGELVAVLWAEHRIHPVFAQSTRMRLLVRYVALAAVVLAAAGTAWTTNHWWRRVEIIKAGLARLGSNLESRVPDLPGELGEITRSINEMAERLLERERLIGELRKSEYLAALGRLVSEIAHELRAPMGVVRAAAEMAAEQLDPAARARVGEYLDLIEQQATRHERLIGSLLDFGKPGAAWESLALNKLLNEVLGATKPLLERRGITLVYEPDPDLPAVRGDREKLKQVFFNLVLNAVEAMGPGGRLTLRTFPDDGSSCVLVADTGVGIAPEDLPHIFKPYYTRKAGGSGLGLAISEEVVRVHGGAIRVCSRPGGGTAFTVCLPALNRGKDGEGTDGTHSDR